MDIYKNKMETHKRDSLINFDKFNHIYSVGNDKYTSVTTLVANQFEKFDADKVIDKMMASNNWPNSKYFGKTKKQIKAQWKKKSQSSSYLGTKLHLDIESFYNFIELEIDDEYKEFNYFLNFENDLPAYLDIARVEWIVWNEDIKIAGSVDAVYRNKIDNTLEICDWKRTQNIKKENLFQKSITLDLQDTNFSKYSLQLNMYKYIIESKYAEKVSKMYLVILHPTNKNYIKIKVPEIDIKNYLQKLIF